VHEEVVDILLIISFDPPTANGIDSSQHGGGDRMAYAAFGASIENSQLHD
jgi:hypothetical protein